MDNNNHNNHSISPFSSALRGLASTLVVMMVGIIAIAGMNLMIVVLTGTEFNSAFSRLTTNNNFTALGIVGIVLVAPMMLKVLKLALDHAKTGEMQRLPGFVIFTLFMVGHILLGASVSGCVYTGKILETTLGIILNIGLAVGFWIAYQKVSFGVYKTTESDKGLSNSITESIKYYVAIATPLHLGAVVGIILSIVINY